MALIQMTLPSIGQVLAIIAGILAIGGIIGALIATFIVKKNERKDKLDADLNNTQTALIGAQEKTIRNRDDSIKDIEERIKKLETANAELLADKTDMFAEYQTLMILYVKDRIQQVAWREENTTLHATLDAMRNEILRLHGDPYKVERLAMEALQTSLGALAGGVLKGHKQ